MLQLLEIVEVRMTRPSERLLGRATNDRKSRFLEIARFGRVVGYSAGLISSQILRFRITRPSDGPLSRATIIGNSGSQNDSAE